MKTLRELHDDPNEEINEIITAQVVMSMFETDTVPLSPDDIIADPQADVFEVRPSDSGDMSFASPEVLLEGKKPDGGGPKDRSDWCFALGMVLYYLLLEQNKDLSLNSSQPLLKLYLSKTGSTPLEADKDYAEARGIQGVRWAAQLTGWDPARRENAVVEIQEWLFALIAQVQIDFVYAGECVRRQTIELKDRPLKVSAGTVFNVGKAKYRATEEIRIRYRPGKHFVTVPVEPVK